MGPQRLDNALGLRCIVTAYLKVARPVNTRWVGGNQQPCGEGIRGWAWMPLPRAYSFVRETRAGRYCIYGDYQLEKR